MENLKLFVLAILTSLLLTFFTGSFANTISGDIPRSYTNGSWYYINRGLPRAWAGVGLVGTKIYSPLIKAPFLRITSDNNQFYKVINLKIFSNILLKNTFIFLSIIYLIKMFFVKIKYLRFKKAVNYILFVVFVLNFIVYFKIFILI